MLALITARGGSKGLPRKHVRDLGGRPLIAWTISAAIDSGVFDRVVVSTDSEEIADISRHCGADVPFRRPSALAEDDSPHVDVVLHALDWLGEHQQYHPGSLTLLQPTSPLRSAADIRAAAELAADPAIPGVVSVVVAKQHPMKAVRMTPGGTLVNFVETGAPHLPRQALPPAYHVNGAIYLIRTPVLRQEQDMIAKGAVGYVMPDERSVDIDTEVDLELAALHIRSVQP